MVVDAPHVPSPPPPIPMPGDHQESMESRKVGGICCFCSVILAIEGERVLRNFSFPSSLKIDENGRKKLVNGISAGYCAQ